MKAAEQQRCLSSDKSSAPRDRILALFEGQPRAIKETEIKRALGKMPWKQAMMNLRQEGMIQQEKDFTITAPSLKMKKLILPADRQWREMIAITGLSRVKSTRERRIRILDALEGHPQGILLERLRSEFGLTASDLKLFEAHGLAEQRQVPDWREPEILSGDPYPAEAPMLTAEQTVVLESVLSSMQSAGEKTPALIQGVTGSGKTEIYLNLAADVVSRGGQVLLLVPEIALTPQITARFENRFPGKTGVYHSRLSAGQRFDTWFRGRKGDLSVVIGPRSALAVPLPNLQLIIVDECHDDSFFQTEAQPYFSAVQCAADYARLLNAQLVLGSATPTIAQRYKAEKSGWNIHQLTRRASGVPQPLTLLIDMRQELKAGNRSLFSRKLIEEMKTTLAQKKQTILLMNRRGSAGYTFCHACGHDFRCPRCEVPLTWHQSLKRLQCHFCGFTEALPAACPTCGESEIRQFSAGIEQVESQLSTLFPQARLIRMDAETTSRQGAYDKILSRFLNREADILLGTKMVAKGLDFPDVRLAGVILADVGTGFHDYRVDEQTYQLLTQVAGRAGRQETQGLAILQTFQPERYSIQAAASCEYETFYQREIQFRKTIGYPPFSRIIRILVQDESQVKAQQAAEALYQHLTALIRRQRRKGIALIGPAPCFFPRIRGKYRWHVILRGRSPMDLLMEIDLKQYRVEVDPPNIL